MTKSERERIRNMFKGHCAYCGKQLGKTFHVDHKTPMRRGMPGSKERDKKSVKFPSCMRCNLWKKTYSVEQFRAEIAKQVERVRRDSAGFRFAEDFGLVQEIVVPVSFYFERFAPESECPF
jgi:hypothetical protein